MNKMILDYFYQKNRIPVFLAGSGGNPVYSSFPQWQSDSCAQFLKWFSDNAEHTPSVVQLNGYELFAYFLAEFEGKPAAAVIGPAYEVHPFTLENPEGTALSLLIGSEYVKRSLLATNETEPLDFCRYAAILSHLFGKGDPDPETLCSKIRQMPLQKLLDKQLIRMVYQIREEERMTAYAPELEAEAFACIRRGDPDGLKNKTFPLIRDPNARKTKNQYLFEIVAMVTLSTRAAVEGGLDVVTAYSLSDLYFKKLSDATSDKEISAVASHVMAHFAERVREAKNVRISDNRNSPYISRSLAYIRTHLHYPITLKDVADDVGLSEKYLSRLFVTTLGEKFSECVNRERIAESKALLEAGDLSMIEISNSLSFSSESYFIKVFSKYVGTTPRKYLEKVSMTK